MADYPISNVARRIVYTGSSGVGPYAFPFEVLTNTDINVYKNDTLLTLTTNYTVSISPTLGTGSITLVVAATGSDRITIIGARAVQRTTDFTTGGDFFANTLNDEMDSQTILTQQVAETADRSIKAPVTDPTSINMTLPKNTDRAGKYLSFNASTGNPEVVNSVTDVTTVAGIAANITTVAGISANVTTVAGNTTNINTVATNISNVNATGSNISNVNAVAGNATNINAVNSNSTNINTVAGNNTNVSTVATNIASVNTNATNITAIQNASSNASAAASSASAASTSASNAASSASAASTSATNAASAKTAAESARDATLAAYDSFDDRYLGPKSTSPTVDNDGNALVAGTLYFDTVSQSMQLYTGTIWTAAYISGSGYLASANNLSELLNTVTARVNLGLAIGADVQAYDADIPTVSASQAEMETGSETANRSMSPLRVKQAIVANAPVAFPSGTKLIFAQTSAPTGWTKDTTHNDKALRVVSGAASSGGTVDFSVALASQTPAGSVSVSGSLSSTTSTGSVGATTLSTAQMPSHTHSQGFIANGNATAGGYTVNTSSAANNTGAQGGGGSHDHSLSMNSHTHTFTGSGSFSGTAINLAVKYVDVIIATKN